MTEIDLMADAIASYDAQGIQPIVRDTFTEKITDPSVQTVQDALKAMFAETPRWLQVTMRVRNRIVGLLGFESGNGQRPEVPAVIEPGQMLSVFKIFEVTEHEILMGGDDRRFSMRISVKVPESGRTVELATTAHGHDRIGRAYLSLVKPFHGPVAKMTTRRIATGSGS